MRRLAPLAVVAGAAVLAGCGGGSDQLSKPEYAKQLQQIVKPVGQAFNDLQGASTKQQVTVALGKANDAVQTASQQVAALNPPSDAVSANSDLGAALGTYEKSIAQTQQAVRSGTSGQVKAQEAVFKQASQSFVSSLNKIKSQLASEGIKVTGQ